MARLHIATVELATHRGGAAELAAFYGDTFGMRVTAPTADRVGLRVGHSTVRFRETAGDERPFYHFAFLVPGNRFAAAYTWLAERTAILTEPGSTDTVFDFSAIDAHACYFHGPAGNIGELIAHHGHEESTVDGAFSSAELVGRRRDRPGDRRQARRGRRAGPRAGHHRVARELREPGRIAFVGRRAHTLILAGPSRGWLPTGRPAEIHPVRVTLTGTRAGTADLAPLPHDVSGG